MFNHNLKIIAINANRRIKRILLITGDVLIISIAFIIAMILRLENVNFLKQNDIYFHLIIIIIPTIFVFAKIGLYRAFLRYFSIEIAFYIIGIIIYNETNTISAAKI